MLYFSLSLLLSLVLSGALLAGLAKSLQINWIRRNRRAISYLAPIGLTLAFLLMTLQLTVPRLLDMVNIVSKTFQTEQVTIDAGEIGWSTLTEDGRVFYFNQWRFHPESGKTYQITYTPRSLFIYDFKEAAEQTEERP